MVKIFKEEKLQQAFDLKGYVVVSFLLPEEVTQLRELYQNEYASAPQGFYSTSFNKDETVKARLMKGVEEIFDKKAQSVFSPFRKLGSCYLSKAPGPEGEMPIHQDWTVVDEPEFNSVTMWVPLCDVDEKNGAMQVVEGSHHFSKALRSPLLPNPFQNVQNEIRQDLKAVSMRAGEALIFSQAILHASPPNLSNEPRLVVTYGLIPQEAQLLFYYKGENGTVEKYHVPDDFFQQYNTNIGSRPESGKKVEEFEFKEQLISVGEYRQMKNDYLKKQQAMFKMKPLFKEATKQQFFEREGYVVFSLLDADEVEDLKQYYQALELKDEKGFGFHVSMDQSDKEMCRRIREKVWSVVLPKMDAHLKDYKPFVSSYVVKETNPKGVVPAHQDWSFVDGEEEGFCSVTCWVALVPTNLDNGCMGVIRGSHKMLPNYHRPSPSPQTPVPLSEHMFSIFPYLKTLEMQPGEVLMFDNRTFHASPPNTSGSIRLAVGVGVTQKDAQLAHYYMKPDGTHSTMLKYKIDNDFFLKYENSTLSKMYDKGEVIEGYELLGEVPYTFPKYTADEMIEKIKAAGNEYNIPMTEKLAKLFGYMNGEKKEEQPKEVPVAAPEPVERKEEWKWVDERGFFEKYTPLNIAREIKKKLTGV